MIKLIFLALLPLALGVITLDEAVGVGLAAFQGQCTRLQSLMPELLEALTFKDLERTRKAYIAARPPYEQIETLANAFSTIDRNIDARPDVFLTGEDDPEWQGFHAIERALYRNQDASLPVLAVAVKLNDEIDKLCETLKDIHRFNPKLVFEGATALAFEVPAKKISSEEETWSDLSLMVFRNNYQGIWAIVRPFFATRTVSRITRVAMKDSFREIRIVLKQIDPDNSFTTLRGRARPYSNVTISERKMFLDVAYKFAVALVKVRDEALEDYPMASPEEELEGEGEGGNPDGIPVRKYRKQVRAGLQHLRRVCRRQQKLLRGLRGKITTGNLKGAKGKYAKTRAPYEQIEVLANVFPELDVDIGGRPDSHATGELSDNWRGMHEVEHALFRDGNLTVADMSSLRLSFDIDELCDKISEGIAGRGAFTAEKSFNGMIALAYEVASKKISSEEETWSDLSLMVFRENMKGIWSQFSPFEEVMEEAAFGEVRATYVSIKTLMKFTLDVGNDFAKGYNFRLYSDLGRDDRRKLFEQFMTLGGALVKAHNSLIA